MAPPSPLEIATSSLQRLVKEEASYHQELSGQEARLEKLLATEDGDENKQYQVKQERTAIEETKNVFPPLRQRIADATAKLEDQLESRVPDATDEQVSKAKEVIKQAKLASAGAA